MWKYNLNCFVLNFVDILIQENTFDSNIGGLLSTAGAISLSCYLNITHSDNSEEGNKIFKYHGFLEGEIDQTFNYLIDKYKFKANMLGTI